MSKRITADLLAGDVRPVGCRVSGGRVVGEASAVFAGAQLPEGVIYACRAESVGRFFLCTSGDCYVSVNGADFSRLNSLEGGTPFLVEEISAGAARAVLVNGENAVAHSGGSFAGIYTGVKLRSGVMRCGRLFAADGRNGLMLRWSGEGGISDWEQKINGAGYMLLEPSRGDILNVVAFGEKIAVVRRRGLTLVNAFGNPEHFSVSPTDTDTDEIFANTAAVADGRLYFYTASGLCSYDGARIERIRHRYSEQTEGPTCAVALAGRYYLACTVGGERAVLCFCCADGESFIYGLAADAMCAADCVYIYNSSGVYRLNGKAGCSFTAGFDFGRGGYKTVTCMLVGGKADIAVGNGRVTRRLEGVCGTVRPRLRGRAFTVTVRSSGDISALTATAEVLDGI